jgi:hypothetical protein
VQSRIHVTQLSATALEVKLGTICFLTYACYFREMDRFAPAADERSRSGTPATSRFTTQAATPEDLLKEQTVGLVHLNDFRKRRAEALERKDRAASNVASGASTPQDG